MKVKLIYGIFNFFAPFLILCILVSACAADAKKNEDKFKVNFYYQDTKTNLCFAVADFDESPQQHTVRNIVCVPCDSLVMKTIDNQRDTIIRMVRRN